MTIVQYLMASGVCTSGELMAYAKQDKEGYNTLKRYAVEQAANEGITLSETAAK